MLITNSKFHDYYDTSNFGMVDKTIVYNRNMQEVHDKDVDNIQTLLRVTYSRSLSESIEFFVIGFCGKYYFCAKYKPKREIKNNRDGIPYYHEPDPVILFDLDKILEKLLEIEKPRSKYSSNWTIERLTNVFNMFNGKEDMSLFRKYNTPIFVIGHKSFVLNPMLKEYEFFRVIDSVQTFQNVQSFISGVLTNPEKDVTNISDKDRILQHGFDYKWSFRKEPKK